MSNNFRILFTANTKISLCFCFTEKLQKLSGIYETQCMMYFVCFYACDLSCFRVIWCTRRPNCETVRAWNRHDVRPARAVRTAIEVASPSVFSSTMSTFENASHTVSRFSQVTLNLIEDQTFPAISQLSSAGRSTTPLQAFIVWNIDSLRTA